MPDKVKLYLVGGALRDKFLGKEPKDIDYAVEAKSFEAMEQYLLDRGADIKVRKPEFFTIRAFLNGEFNDYVLCRKEGLYKDGIHPNSVEVGTIYDDLSRRDFGFNSFSQDIATGEYYDPFNGIADIKNKVIRCVGSFDRLIEDYLRILRAIRFWITLDFTFEEGLLEFIRDNWRLLDKVSIERVHDEVNKMFAAGRSKTMRRMDIIDPNLWNWIVDHEHTDFKLITRKN